MSNGALTDMMYVERDRKRNRKGFKEQIKKNRMERSRCDWAGCKGSWVFFGIVIKEKAGVSIRSMMEGDNKDCMYCMFRAFLPVTRHR